MLRHQLPISSLSYIIILLLMLTVGIGARRDCLATKCLKEYNKINQARVDMDKSESNLSLSKSNDEFYESLKVPCRAVRTLSRCFRKVEKVCHGDLYFHSYKRTLTTEKRKHKCKMMRKYFRKKTLQQTTATTNTITTTNTTTNKSIYEMGPFVHCSLFGDPHLRTFDDQFFTCKIQGTWTLVENRHLAVMVTNAPIYEGSAATITTKITIIIKSDENRFYVATSSSPLPSAFKDGSTRNKRVIIRPITSGRHVQIDVVVMATTIVIRHVGNYLTFAIRMPQVLSDAKTTGALCAVGCPKSNQLETPSSGQIDEKSARHHCRVTLLTSLGRNELGDDVTVASRGDQETVTSFESPSSFSFRLLQASSDVTSSKQRERQRRDVMTSCDNFYFDSCVFDLMTSGDINLTLTSGVALLDVRDLHHLGSYAPGADVRVIERWPDADLCHLQHPSPSSSSQIISSHLLIFLFFPFFLLIT